MEINWAVGRSAELEAWRRADSVGVPRDPQRGGLRNTSPLGGARWARQPQVRQAEDGGDGLRLQARQIHGDAHVRTLGEGQLAAQIRPGEVELVGGREDLGIAVRARDRHPDEVTARDLRAAEVHVVRRVAVDHGSGGFEAQRLLDGRGDQTRIRENGGQGRRMHQQVQTALVIIASVVSMPPNIMTAAFDTSGSGRVTASRSTDGSGGGRPARVRRVGDAPSSAAGRLAAGAESSHGGHDVAVPTQHRRSVDVLQP